MRRLLDGGTDTENAAIGIGESHGGYFFLPSLRKMYSSEYFTPLPL